MSSLFKFCLTTCDNLIADGYVVDSLASSPALLFFQSEIKHHLYYFTKEELQLEKKSIGVQKEFLKEQNEQIQTPLAEDKTFAINDLPNEAKNLQERFIQIESLAATNKYTEQLRYDYMTQLITFLWICVAPAIKDIEQARDLIGLVKAISEHSVMEQFTWAQKASIFEKAFNIVNELDEKYTMQQTIHIKLACLTCHSYSQAMQEARVLSRYQSMELLEVWYQHRAKRTTGKEEYTARTRKNAA